MTVFRSILRNVTLKPLTRVTNVSPASLIIDGIATESSKVEVSRQMGAVRVGGSSCGKTGFSLSGLVSSKEKQNQTG